MLILYKSQLQMNKQPLAARSISPPRRAHREHGALGILLAFGHRQRTEIGQILYGDIFS